MSSAIAISVVIPHLNQPDQLRACLESLARQDFDMRRVEIIVVDNGSGLPPHDICSGFEGVRLVEEPVPGPGPARNRGVGVSRGELLAFIDADCLADPGWLGAIEAALTPHMGAGTGCSPDRAPPSGGPHPGPPPRGGREQRGATSLPSPSGGGAGGGVRLASADQKSSCSSAMVIGGDVRIARRDPERATMLEAYECVYAYRQEDYIARQGFSGTGNLAMARQAYDAVGPFCGIERAEDRDWGRRATRAGFAIRYVPEMIVHHPARQSFADLCTKWDRHVSHDFENAAPGPAGRLRWLARAAAVAASPVFEARRLLTSSRVDTVRERLLAAGVLVRIRVYRAYRMLSAIAGGADAWASRRWNRS